MKRKNVNKHITPEGTIQRTSSRKENPQVLGYNMLLWVWRDRCWTLDVRQMRGLNIEELLRLEPFAAEERLAPPQCALCMSIVKIARVFATVWHRFGELIVGSRTLASPVTTLCICYRFSRKIQTSRVWLCVYRDRGVRSNLIDHEYVIYTRGFVVYN